MFDLTSLDAALTGTIFAGKLHFAAVTDSTNTDALEAARAGAPDGAVYFADEQLAGRGRCSSERVGTGCGRSGCERVFVDDAGDLMVATDADVIQAVASTPGAIGFVEERSITDRVSVVKVDGKLPMESGYLPH